MNPRIALVQTFHPYTQFTHVHPLGIMCVASGARAAGFTDLHLIDMKVETLSVADAADRLERLRPEVVGLSAMTYEAGCLHSLAAEVKRRLPGVLVVAGGPHPSVAADEVLEDPSVDYVVRGEADLSFPDLLRAHFGGADLGSIAGISWRRPDGTLARNPDRPPPANLDDLPFPAWDLVPMEKYHTVPRGGVIYWHREFATLFSSRACPWRCTYCHNSYGKVFRERSARNVLAEIDLLVSRYGVKELVFMDDIFNFKPERAKGICRGLIERDYRLKLTFPNGLRGDLLDEELIGLMRKAGMYRTSIAIESAVPRLQKVMKKNLNLARTEANVRRLAEAGVLTHGFFMLGFPTETREEMRETIRWARRSPFHTAAFFRVIPFKGTALYEQVQQAGHALPTDWSQYEPYYSDINLSAVPEGEIARLRRKAYVSFYLSPARMLRFLKLLPNKRRLVPTLSLLFARRAYAR
ncbi:MAG: B12-binding domain-containing radical SAM protein [Planctomycetes bacterium]|nr:B12-binding domain-containing radical SAM protein [Planctomycetota bacterium]